MDDHRLDRELRRMEIIARLETPRVAGRERPQGAQRRLLAVSVRAQEMRPRLP